MTRTKARIEKLEALAAPRVERLPPVVHIHIGGEDPRRVCETCKGMTDAEYAAYQKKPKTGTVIRVGYDDTETDEAQD